MEIQNSVSDNQDHDKWHWMFKLGGIAALINAMLIPIQIIVYMISPPPTLVNDWFSLLQDNWLLGLLNLDLLYLVNNILIIPIYLALFIALKPLQESFVTIALAMGLVGISAYFSSNTAFEMLALSEQYAVATSETQQMILSAAGEALMVKYQGTAFLAYYVLNAIALLIFTIVMLRSDLFSKKIAYAGITSGVLMLVPSTFFGVIGLIFAFASLLPWTIFSLLIARRLYQMGNYHHK